MKALCDFCGWIENIRLSDNPVTMSQNGIRFTYDETWAFCAGCGCPVYVAEISDRNAEKRLEAYEKAKRNREALVYNLRTEAKRVKGYAAAVALMRDAATALEVEE